MRNARIMRPKRIVLALAVALLAGCGSTSKSPAPASTTAPQSPGSTKALVGAGSTFVFPLISQWTGDYAKRAGVTITYGAVGSGAGIAAVTDRTVDFGASDAPLSADQMTACKGCIEIPWALGGTSIAYNLQGAPAHLRLSGAVLASIYLGKITAWNDPAIAQLNPGTTLPSTRIAPVFRSDSSGTSYNFTDYLSHVSAQWKSKIGVSTQPSFPAGQGAKGSAGVAGVLAHTNGAITYVDVAYAEVNHFSYAAIENTAGKFVLPDVASINAAAAAARSPKRNAGISIVQPPASAASAYPISTFTYVIVPQSSSRSAALKEFLDYTVTSGQRFGPKLLFAPLPSQVVATDKVTIASIG